MGRVQNVRNRKAITDPRALRLIKECVDATKAMGYTLPKGTRFLSCKATRRAGLASYSDSTIVLSNFLFEEADEHAKSTILHEIAHLIAGPGVHHGPAWQRIIRKMTQHTGIKITRCYNEENMPVHTAARNTLYKYIFQCEGCGCKIHRMKETEFTRTYDEILPSGKPRWTCRACGSTFKLISTNK